jgi:hypothetical protein
LGNAMEKMRNRKSSRDTVVGDIDVTALQRRSKLKMFRRRRKSNEGI